MAIREMLYNTAYVGIALTVSEPLASEDMEHSGKADQQIQLSRDFDDRLPRHGIDGSITARTTPLNQDFLPCSPTTCRTRNLDMFPVQPDLQQRA